MALSAEGEQRTQKEAAHDQGNPRWDWRRRVGYLCQDAQAGEKVEREKRDKQNARASRHGERRPDPRPDWGPVDPPVGMDRVLASLPDFELSGRDDANEFTFDLE